MKVTLPEKFRLKKKEAIIYGIIVCVCIISVIGAFYVQFYGRIDFGKMLGIDKSENVFGTKTEEEIEAIKLGFENIFDNKVTYSENVDNKKANKEQEIIYTKYNKDESKINSYELNIHIPYINIDNEIINEYNEEIEDFYKKAEEVLQNENENIIYTVDYTSNIQNGILSLIIRSNLKEGTTAQREIIQTYNYDLRNNKEITLEEILKIVDVDSQTAQNKINAEIETQQKRVKELKGLGYNIFSRDTENEIYNIENVEEYYVTNNTLYILFAYGNSANTSEKDIIII